MMCVKLTLPPRERARWLLITTRLSISSLAGTARTLVAVGTVRLVSMLATTRAAGPRRGALSASSDRAGAGAVAAAGWAAAAGCGALTGAGCGVTAVFGASAGWLGAAGAG